jgi:hypothetical protein
MFVDRVIEGEKNTPLSGQFCGLKPQLAPNRLVASHQPAIHQSKQARNDIA